jgi:hypothetical protein
MCNRAHIVSLFFFFLQNSTTDYFEQNAGADEVVADYNLATLEPIFKLTWKQNVANNGEKKWLL